MPASPEHFKKLSLLPFELMLACVCVCVCVCVYLNKTIDVIPEIRPAMLCGRNRFVSSTFITYGMVTIIAGTFKLATVQECQLNRAEPREIKGNS